MIALLGNSVTKSLRQQGMVGSVRLANKQGASAVKLGFTLAYAVWRQCDPKFILQDVSHTLVGLLQPRSVWRLLRTALHLQQKLSRTKAPRAAIIM